VYVGGVLGYVEDSSDAVICEIKNCFITDMEMTVNAPKRSDSGYGLCVGGILGFPNNVDTFINACQVRDCIISNNGDLDYLGAILAFSGGIVGRITGTNTSTISQCMVVDSSISASAGSFRTAYAVACVAGDLTVSACMFESDSDYNLIGLVDTDTNITIGDCLCRGDFTFVQTNNGVSFTVADVIIESVSKQYIPLSSTSTEFANWGIVNNKPLPNGLFWIATVGETCDHERLLSLGYSQGTWTN